MYPARQRSTLTTWLAVLVCFGLIDIGIREIFVPRVVAPKFDPPGVGLRDHTSGQNLGILFTLAADHVRPSHRTVVLVGDSTVAGIIEPEADILAVKLQAALRELSPALAHVEVIEFAALGLNTPEAAVAIAKGVVLGADLVIYATTPRVVCTLEGTPTDAEKYALDWGVASRLGPELLLQAFSLDGLATGAVRSRWKFLAFRREIHESIAQGISAEVSPRLGRALAHPHYQRPSIMERTGGRGGAMWAHENCSLGTDSVGIRALTRIADICATSGRCVVYLGPINPDGMQSFEPGLLADFMKFEENSIRARSVPFLDYHELLSPLDFKTPSFGRVDAIHLNPTGRQKLASRLAEDIAPALTGFSR